MKRRLSLIVLCLLMATTGIGGARRQAPTTLPIGLTRILSAFDPARVVRGIATFDAVPSRRHVAGLRALGLVVQPMKRLPLAIVKGPVAALKHAVNGGIANDVYPDERIHLMNKESSDHVGAAVARARGYTGKGITVGVVDSGCDASHPDLADHVVHNVKLISAEYVNVRPDESNTLVIPFEMGPYQNSDIGSGHGTHVAGIIAADGTTDAENIGMAPDAELVCMAIGEVLFTTAVTTAYDFLLRQPGLWGVDVINNSWGNPFFAFDPAHPVHVATRAVAALGVTVVFSAGNNGSEQTEATMNPFSAAPWVISVANGTLEHGRNGSSSNGFKFDNAQPRNRGAGGHHAFDRAFMGMYHPDMTAPGTSISSTCDTAGAAIGPCPPYGNEEASGTSMAAPHVAGAAALLRQANPKLNIDQVRRALQATATPVWGNTEKKSNPLGFWSVGYGYINVGAALRLVTSSNWAENIIAAQRAADRRVMRAIGYHVPRSDIWTWDAPRVALMGLTDTRTFRTFVPARIKHLKVTVAHPSLTQVAGNSMIYEATVTDAAGTVLGTTEESPGSGSSSLLLDLRKLNAKAGFYDITVSGILAAADPDTFDSESLLGRYIVLQVAQLIPR